MEGKAWVELRIDEAETGMCGEKTVGETAGDSVVVVSLVDVSSGPV